MTLSPSGLIQIRIRLRYGIVEVSGILQNRAKSSTEAESARSLDLIISESSEYLEEAVRMLGFKMRNGAAGKRTVLFGGSNCPVSSKITEFVAPSVRSKRGKFFQSSGFSGSNLESVFELAALAGVAGYSTSGLMAMPISFGLTLYWDQLRGFLSNVVSITGTAGRLGFWTGTIGGSVTMPSAARISPERAPSNPKSSSSFPIAAFNFPRRRRYVTTRRPSIRMKRAAPADVRPTI